MPLGIRMRDFYQVQIRSKLLPFNNLEFQIICWLEIWFKIKFEIKFEIKFKIEFEVEFDILYDNHFETSVSEKYFQIEFPKIDLIYISKIK